MIVEYGIILLSGGNVRHTLSIFKDTADYLVINNRLDFGHLQAVKSGRIKPSVTYGVVSEIQHDPVGVNFVHTGDGF